MEEHEWELEAGGVLDWLELVRRADEAMTCRESCCTGAGHAAAGRAIVEQLEREARWAPVTEGF